MQLAFLFLFSTLNIFNQVQSRENASKVSPGSRTPSTKSAPSDRIPLLRPRLSKTAQNGDLVWLTPCTNSFNRTIHNRMLVDRDNRIRIDEITYFYRPVDECVSFSNDNSLTLTSDAFSTELSNENSGGAAYNSKEAACVFCAKEANTDDAPTKPRLLSVLTVYWSCPASYECCNWECCQLGSDNVQEELSLPRLLIIAVVVVLFIGTAILMFIIIQTRSSSSRRSSLSYMPGLRQ